METLLAFTKTDIPPIKLAEIDVDRYGILETKIPLDQSHSEMIGYRINEYGANRYYVYDPLNKQLHLGTFFLSMVGDTTFLQHLKYQVLEYLPNQKELQELRYRSCPMISSDQIESLGFMMKVMIADLKQNKENLQVLGNSQTPAN